MTIPGLDDPIGVVSFGCSSESAPPNGMPSMVRRLRVDPPQTMTVTHTISKVAAIQKDQIRRDASNQKLEGPGHRGLFEGDGGTIGLYFIAQVHIAL